MNGDLKNSDSEIIVMIVIPCFNEEGTLASTCASFGFGIGRETKSLKAILFIIDNNSTDLTIVIAENIKSNSSKDTVFIGHEKEQGFVPPRHKGNLIAKELALTLNLPLDSVLILQADADTIYSHDYINSMRIASQTFGLNTLIEACVDYTPEFKNEYYNYINLCNNIDKIYTKLFATDLSDDDIVDDKVSGYRLSDYFFWGGHRREYNSIGEEIHAETARLFIAAKVKGAKRGFANAAVAYHSSRKILQNPISHLATAGFPREASWYKEWQKKYKIPVEYHISESTQILHSILNMDLDFVIRTRKKHLIAIFGILPLHIDRVLQEIPSIISKEFSNLVLPMLPKRTKKDILNRPSIFLIDVFSLIDRNEGFLLDQADNLTK